MKRLHNINKNGVWYLHLKSKFARTVALGVIMSFVAVFVVVLISSYIALSDLLMGNNLAANTQNQTASPSEVVSYYPLQTVPPFTVAIDSGHGGFDTGASGILEEIDVCDNTSKALFELLDKDKNFTPVLTRVFGEDLSTADRAANATEHKASLLISIHANYDASTSQSHGFECFAMPPGRYYNEQSLYFASLIVQGMSSAGHRIRGDNGIRYLYYTNDGNSKKIVESTTTETRDENTFGMLEKPLCPSVLVEQCFLSNTDDVEQWASEDGCKKAAHIYYEAICAYFGTKPIS